MLLLLLLLCFPYTIASPRLDNRSWSQGGLKSKPHAPPSSITPSSLLVQNHISVDAEAVLNLMVFQMFMWSALVRLISCVVLLFWVLGLSAISGLTLIFLSLPMNKVGFGGGGGGVGRGGRGGDRG